MSSTLQSISPHRLADRVALVTGGVSGIGASCVQRFLTEGASVAVMEVGGRKTAVYPASGGVVGVDLADGKVLWEYPDWRIRIANVPTPVVIDAERVFLSGGYNTGSLMLRIRVEGDRLVPEKLFKIPHRVFGSHQQTPVLYQGHLYGVKQDGRLTCLDLDGKALWTSGGRKFGKGPYLIADGTILALDDDGTLTMAEATPSGFRPIARAKILTGHEAWGPMALVHGRLLLRDLTQMACIDLRAE